MGALLAALTGLSLLSPQSQDTTPTYATTATKAVVERAMARQRTLDSAVTDYQATIRYRLTLSLGRRRWGRSMPTAVEEQDARVHWKAPNDVRVDVLGRRQAARSKDFSLESVWDRPWFVPRSLGDSVRIFSDEFPAIAPLHPLAASGPDWYRYELVDSLALSTPDGRRIRVLQLDVAPRKKGESLLTGRLWVDAATSEVVRFAFRYVGVRQWVRPDTETPDDSSDARRANTLINRFFSLDADLEYALQAGQYWLPHRQVIAGRISIPLVSDVVIPFEAVTTFRDYEVNTGKAPTFTLDVPAHLSPDSARARWKAREDSLRKARRGGGDIPDSLWSRDYAGWWEGGRYEIHRPPEDSLALYTTWGDSLRLETRPEDAVRQREIEGELAKMVEDLPRDVTGVPSLGITMERLADLLGYNRVQGLTAGFGVGWQPAGLRFTTLYPTLRYGLSDGRLTARLALVRNAPGSKLTVAAYRDVVDVDPVSLGRTIPNSVNALFAAHDNADYMEAIGGSAALVLPAGERAELRLAGRVERHNSVKRAATSGINDFFGGDGEFPDNAPVTEGTFAGLAATLSGGDRTRWGLTADVLAGSAGTTGRLWGEVRREFGTGRGALVRLKAGAATEDPLPQMAFRAGGQQTVRAFDYGTLRGQAFWSAMVDVTPWGGTFRPVIFADAGWAGALDRVTDDQPLVGAGVGLSIYSSLLRSGLIRFDLSRQLVPDDAGLRFDIIVTAFR